MMRKIYWAVALCAAVLLTACETEDLYQEKEEPIIPDTPEVQIDWSTHKTTRLNVVVEDEYNGKYYYTVEAYVGNPANDSNAKLIAGSGQKTNNKVTYSREIVIPDALETMFIMITDPFLRKRVYAVEAREGTTTFYPGKMSIDTRSQSVITKAEIPSVSFDYADDAEVLVGATAVTLKHGVRYLVKEGTVFSGNLTFPGDGDVKIYVEGTLAWSNSVILQKNVEIYVLAGGQVKSKSGTIKLTMNQSAFIAIQSGGSWGEESSNAMFDLSLTNQNKIINDGHFYANTVTMNAQSGLYNTAFMKLGSLSTENQIPIVNTHELDIKTLNLKNATIDNSCMFTVDQFNVLANGTIAKTGYIYARALSAKGLTMNMEDNAMWEGETAVFEGQKCYIKGGSDGYALFKVKDIKANSWESVNYSGKIEIECTTHTQLASIHDKKYTATDEVAFAVGQASVEILPSDCNNNRGNKNKGGGDGDNDPIYEEKETLAYTYLFEDNWPGTGDYDMNDIVMSVELKNTVNGNKTTGTKVITTLYAVGATKTLGAGFQLDGIPANNVSGAESGQDYAVLRLFDNAHQTLGVPAAQPANTYWIDYPAVVIEKDIVFNTPIDGVINVNNFNLFILTDGDFSAEKWNEVHLAGYKGTNKAVVNENSTSTYQQVETGWMWGLSIPQIDFASYPREGSPINEAYNGFTEWVKGDETPGWYLNPIDESVLIYEDVVIE